MAALELMSAVHGPLANLGGVYNPKMGDVHGTMHTFLQVCRRQSSELRRLYVWGKERMGVREWANTRGVQQKDESKEEATYKSRPTSQKQPARTKTSYSPLLQLSYMDPSFINLRAL